MIDVNELDRRLEDGEAIMTAEEFDWARRELSLTFGELASALRMYAAAESDLRKMARGKKGVTGPIASCLVLMLERAGKLPG